MIDPRLVAIAEAGRVSDAYCDAPRMHPRSRFDFFLNRLSGDELMGDDFSTGLTKVF